MSNLTTDKIIFLIWIGYYFLKFTFNLAILDEPAIRTIFGFISLYLLTKGLLHIIKIIKKGKNSK